MSATPQHVYRQRRRDLDRLLELIGRELANHQREHDATPDSWGPPGDLGFVRRSLREVLAFLSPHEESDIEKLLAEPPSDGRDEEPEPGERSELQSVLARLGESLAELALAEAERDSESHEYEELWRLARHAGQLAD